MFWSFYIHRHFPDEFSLSWEIFVNLVVGWLIDTFINVTNLRLSESKRQTDFCFFVVKLDAATDMFRCLTFVVIIYAITMRSFCYFPLPFTWVFKDFTKFLFEPTCVQIFMRYISEKHPERLDTLRRLMKLYSIEFDLERASNASNLKSTVIVGINTIFSSTMSPANPSVHNSSRNQFLECVSALEPCFNEYKKTLSAHRLFMKLKEFEEITEHASTTW